jgi:hypothetical protein
MVSMEAGRAAVAGTIMAARAITVAGAIMVAEVIVVSEECGSRDGSVTVARNFHALIAVVRT